MAQKAGNYATDGSHVAVTMGVTAGLDSGLVPLR